jgi:hypothetical protein
MIPGKSELPVWLDLLATSCACARADPEPPNIPNIPGFETKLVSSMVNLSNPYRRQYTYCFEPIEPNSGKSIKSIFRSR